MSNQPMYLFFRLFDAGSGIAMDSKFRISGGCERRTGAIDLGFPKDRRPTSRSPDLSLPAARARDRSGEPGLVYRNHRSSGKRSTGPFSGPPHRDAPGLFVPGRHLGLVQPQGSHLAALQHHGRRFPCRGPGGGSGPPWQAGDLQLRSRQPVHQRGLHAGPEGRRREDLHGRQGMPGWTMFSSSDCGAR